MIIDESLELTFQACKRWLKYKPKEFRGLLDVSVPAQRLESDFRGGTAERVGGYRPALREAQFFWAVRSLNDPFHQAAAHGMRIYKYRGQVLFWLSQNYTVTWNGWQAEHPGSSEVYFELLRDDVAELMAIKLGVDLY